MVNDVIRSDEYTTRRPSRAAMSVANFLRPLNPEARTGRNPPAAGVESAVRPVRHMRPMSIMNMMNIMRHMRPMNPWTFGARSAVGVAAAT